MGDSVTKLIELNNSTQKGISYYVKYEGSDDFIIEESNFKIEPKSVYKFKVNYINLDKISIKNQRVLKNENLVHKQKRWGLLSCSLSL